ncbi:hypothetical protein MMC13_007310 [Lambiella insularis]|nr:hypothetical protein [Lambiella insularis]
MGKKRKVTGKLHTAATPTDGDPSEAKLRINTYEDVADSEDEFHINRDKILLDEGPARKRQRKQEEEDALLEPSDEEVLAYGSSEDDLEEEDYADEAQSTEEIGDDVSALDAPARQDGSEVSEAQEVDEDTGGWGSSKKDYYNADVIETEADALEEEEEAIRLQKKQLQGMTEADFGFDEIDWLHAEKVDAGADDDGYVGTLREILPQFTITDSMGDDEKTKVLTTRYPEFEPLAQELLSLRTVHENLLMNVSDNTSSDDHNNSTHWAQKVEPDLKDNSISVIKHSALSAYLAALCMYFALFTSGMNDDGTAVPKPSGQLRDHPIMETLIHCRSLWEKVKGVEVPKTLKRDVASSPTAIADHKPTAQEVRQHDNGGSKIPISAAVKHKKRRRSQAQLAAETALADAQLKRAERLQRTEEDLAKLSSRAELIGKPVTSSDQQKVTQQVDDGNYSDFGEETSLTAEEAAEKAKRKKSLRFYTSQIAQKANKRDLAGRDAGGDADLPYRERFKDRVARLNDEAEAKGKKKRVNAAGDNLGGESDDDDRRVAKEIRGDGGNEDYYSLVKARFEKKKATKAALSAAREAAAKEGGIGREVETIGPDGKRGITYAIEKNKGITPNRKKDVRNPRVKKRKKYEDKMKKLGSVKAVYKGGEGRGGYGGELTGIKKGLVRSVKL